MQLFEVRYSIGNSTNTSNLSTVVSADHMSQARAIVENMFGGSSNCQVISVCPK
jgi:hypothetical protein